MVIVDAVLPLSVLGELQLRTRFFMIAELCNAL